MDKWMTRFIKISNIRYYIYILAVAKKGTGEVCLSSYIRLLASLQSMVAIKNKGGKILTHSIVYAFLKIKFILKCFFKNLVFLFM